MIHQLVWRSRTSSHRDYTAFCDMVALLEKIFSEALEELLSLVRGSPVGWSIHSILWSRRENHVRLWHLVPVCSTYHSGQEEEKSRCGAIGSYQVMCMCFILNRILGFGVWTFSAFTVWAFQSSQVSFFKLLQGYEVQTFVRINGPIVIFLFKLGVCWCSSNKASWWRWHKIDAGPPLTHQGHTELKARNDHEGFLLMIYQLVQRSRKSSHMDYIAFGDTGDNADMDMFV